MPVCAMPDHSNTSNVPRRSCDWMRSDVTSVPITDVTETPGTSPMRVSSDVCASLGRRGFRERSARHAAWNLKLSRNAEIGGHWVLTDIRLSYIIQIVK